MFYQVGFPTKALIVLKAILRFNAKITKIIGTLTFSVNNKFSTLCIGPLIESCFQLKNQNVVSLFRDYLPLNEEPLTDLCFDLTV